MKRILIIFLILIASVSFAVSKHTIGGMEINSGRVSGSAFPPGVFLDTGAIATTASTLFDMGTVHPRYAGTLFCNGAVASQATYPDLYAVIGTAYNTGGETADSFRLPDCRGIFRIGAGTSGVYGSNYVGVRGGYGQDKAQGHFHEVFNNSSFYVTVTAVNNAAGAYNPWGVAFSAVADRLQARSQITDGTNGSPRTGAITTPAHLGVNVCITY